LTVRFNFLVPVFKYIAILVLYYFVVYQFVKDHLHFVYQSGCKDKGCFLQHQILSTLF